MNSYDLINLQAKQNHPHSAISNTERGRGPRKRKGRGREREEEEKREDKTYIPPTSHLTLIRNRTRPGNNHHRHPRPTHIMNRTTHRQRAGIDMDEHSLHLPRDLPIAVGSTETDHLIRGGDELQIRPAIEVAFCDRLDDGGVVGSEVDEEVRDPGCHEGFEDRAGGGIWWWRHGLYIYFSPFASLFLSRCARALQTDRPR
jgi:hypothetical protein